MTDPTPNAHVFAAQKSALAARRQSFGLKERRAALARLSRALLAHEGRLLAAMAADCRKPATEASLWEIVPVLNEISHARRHLRRWMRTSWVPPSLTMLGTSAALRPEPRGVALIIAPWNFPVLLALGPLVSALAAGNSAMLKPSEMMPATSAALAAMLRETFPADLVAVAEGGADVATELLALPFDHIFFTGSGPVGKIVMAAAAKTLASVTLELGGKSPVIVGPGADIARAARAIAWGKCANVGQTCVAPDHVFVHRSVEGPLVAALEGEIARAYGTAQTSPDYGRVVNERHFARLTGLLDEALAMGATVVSGGQRNADDRFLAPTILTGTTPEMRISQEEIFGPILPVIPFDDLADPLAAIEAGPAPLALYIFEREKAFADRVLAASRSGTVGINLNVVQFVHPNLPFGGIGASGLGAAHGYAGFCAFSHLRPVLKNRFSALPLLFPPYGPRVRALAKALAWLVR